MRWTSLHHSFSPKKSRTRLMDYLQYMMLTPIRLSVRSCDYSPEKPFVDQRPQSSTTRAMNTWGDGWLQHRVEREMTRMLRTRAVQYTDRVYPTEKTMGFRFKNIMPTLCPAVQRPGHFVGSNIYFTLLPQLRYLVFNPRLSVLYGRTF
jgi:hypothetical protein